MRWLVLRHRSTSVFVASSYVDLYFDKNCGCVKVHRKLLLCKYSCRSVVDDGVSSFCCRNAYLRSFGKQPWFCCKSTDWSVSYDKPFTAYLCKPVTSNCCFGGSTDMAWTLSFIRIVVETTSSVSSRNNVVIITMILLYFRWWLSRGHHKIRSSHSLLYRYNTTKKIYAKTLKI